MRLPNMRYRRVSNLPFRINYNAGKLAKVFAALISKIKVSLQRQCSHKYPPQQPNTLLCLNNNYPDGERLVCRDLVLHLKLMRRDELSAPSVAASLPLLEDLMRLVTVPLPQYIHHPGPATSVSRIYPSVLYDNFMGTPRQSNVPEANFSALTCSHFKISYRNFRNMTTQSCFDSSQVPPSSEANTCRSIYLCATPGNWSARGKHDKPSLRATRHQPQTAFLPL